MGEVKHFDFSVFTDQQLLQLHAQVRAEITRRQIAAERLKVRYGRTLEIEGPKYRNPQNTAETWSGRGKRPQWVEIAMARGASLESLAIDDNHPMPHPRERAPNSRERRRRR
jgi:DNA-binding protein H-NS